MLNEEEYLSIRDTLKEHLLSSPYIQGITICNYWDLYGRCCVKLKSDKYIFLDFKILVRIGKLEYFIGTQKLDELPLDHSYFVNSKQYCNIILASIIKAMKKIAAKNPDLLTKDEITFK